MLGINLKWTKNLKLSTKLMLPILVGGLLMAGISIYNMLSIKKKHVEIAGIDTARRMAQQIAELRTFYTNEVVSRARESGMDINYDFTERDSTLPLPATLVHYLGDRISEAYPGMVVRLYSRHPFPHRAASQEYDEFELEAITKLEHDPHTPVHRLEQYNGRLSMRYAAADIMRPSCVSCHNTHPESPKIDWSEGDVRGVVEVIVPVDEADALMLLQTIQLNGAIVLGILIILLSVVVIIRRTVIKPVKKLAEQTEAVARGDLQVLIEEGSKDEIGQLANSFATMVQTMSSVVGQVKSISDGHYAVRITPRSDKDELSTALNELTSTLNTVTAQNEEQNWLQTGQVELANKLRGEQEIISLAQEGINFLAAYLDAQIGAVYLEDGDGFALVGSYAYTHRNGFAQRFKLGEGIVGQAALEQKIIHITDIPDGYVRIQSGLGRSKPVSLVVVPLLYEGTVTGVIELGAFQEFSDAQINLLKLVAENMAIGFNSAVAGLKMHELLEESRLQAQELQVQQGMLQEANEELEEKAQALMESQARLQSQQEELQQNNEALEQQAATLEEQRDEIGSQNIQLEKAQKALQEKAADLEQASKYKSEFLANMSHELRTPLNSLLILSKLLSENRSGNLNEKQVEFADTIHVSANDLLSLINDILDLSKVEAGKLVLSIEPLNLQDYGLHVERHFNHIATNKALTFEVDIADNLPVEIMTDSQRVEQVLRNFLSNAFKFTRRGSVKFSVSRPEPGLVLSRSDLTASNTVVFTVSDTGIGISKDKQQLIFEAFQQADGTTSRKYGGTGLGLSICRELAKLLGGEIQLYSEEGKGSTFSLFLPENIPANPAGQSSSTTSGSLPTESAGQDVDTVPADKAEPVPLDYIEAPSFGEVTMLIIEDDPRFAGILTDLAEGKGFKCEVAITGNSGIHKALQLKPQAIILDIGLPDMNGLAVLERLKKMPETSHIPVHVMSAVDSSHEAMKLGAVEFLAKPVYLDDLENTFKKIEGVISKSVKTILLIEDNEVQRRTMLELIADREVETTAVATGEEAYSLLQKESYDCMILDLGLSNMSGFELLEKINENPSLQKPAVIVYTAMDLTREEQAQLEEHAQSIIIKGAKSPDRLLDEITLFLHHVETALPQQEAEPNKFIGEKEAVLDNKKVLLVDDDMRNVFALSHVLEDHGMKVTVGKNGLEALSVLERNPDIDLVLMDIMMPEMDGYEATRRIRRMGQFDKLPIIALTAKAMAGDRAKCIDAGASDYLTKPIDAEKLLSLLRVWLYQNLSPEGST